MWSGFKVLHSAEPLAYTGRELRPHFLLEHFGLEGSGIVVFEGSARVDTGDLVDWEDRLAHDRIEARSMVHVIGEFFGLGLREGVLLQRLIQSLALETLREMTRGSHTFERQGDDLYCLDAGRHKKLSVSIVTVSPVSSLLHTGINIDATGAPVLAGGLKELGLNSKEFSKLWMERVQSEWTAVERACVKVRPVF